MSRQPEAARERATGQSGGEAPSASGPATASTSAAATTSGRWLIAATARSWLAASMRIGRARHATASVSTATTAGRSSGSVGTTTHGRSTNRSGGGSLVAASSRGRPSGGRRRSAGRAPRRAATIAAFVLATSVITVSGARAGRSPAPSRPTSSMVAVRWGREDDEIARRRSPPAGRSAAVSMTPSAAARPGPSPVGLQAVTVQADRSGASARARAIDPPMSPKPRIATRMGRVSQHDRARSAAHPVLVSSSGSGGPDGPQRRSALPSEVRPKREPRRQAHPGAARRRPPAPDRLAGPDPRPGAGHRGRRCRRHRRGGQGAVARADGRRPHGLPPAGRHRSRGDPRDQGPLAGRPRRDAHRPHRRRDRSSSRSRPAPTAT